MAKAAAKAEKSTKKQPQTKRSRLTPFLIYLCLGGLLFVSPPIAALAILGLIPTFVILFIDVAPEKATRLNTMFAFNLSGVLPYLMELWSKGATLSHLMEIIGDLVAWTVMLGAAGVGAAMLWLCPILAAGVQQMLNFDRAARLEKRREQLLEEWGEDAAG